MIKKERKEMAKCGLQVKLVIVNSFETRNRPKSFDCAQMTY
jgi:hypothetical protein